MLLTLIAWIGGYGVFLSNIQAVTPQDPKTNTDAVVVLTGGNYRITTGLTLFSQQSAPTLFISGVHPSVDEKEIRLMWKGKTELPDCCIILGHEATTTFENALETEEWIKENNIKSIRLVTSTYHMKRALMEFHNIVKDTKIIPHPVEIPDYKKEDLLFWKITFDEYNKVLYRTGIFYLERQGILK